MAAEILTLILTDTMGAMTINISAGGLGAVHLAMPAIAWAAHQRHSLRVMALGRGSRSQTTSNIPTTSVWSHRDQKRRIDQANRRPPLDAPSSRAKRGSNAARCKSGDAFNKRGRRKVVNATDPSETLYYSECLLDMSQILSSDHRRRSEACIFHRPVSGDQSFKPC